MNFLIYISKLSFKLKLTYFTFNSIFLFEKREKIKKCD